MPRDALQGRGIGWRGAGRARVQKRVARDQLAQVPVVRNVEVAESRVLWIRSILLHSGKTSHRFGRDNGTHPFTRRVDEVQVVGLPAEVPGGSRQHVVGEHGGKLGPDRAKRAGHRGIHRAGAQIRAVELVDHAR